MVHLQKVRRGQETYFYIVHNYRNKFGRPWRRILIRLGKTKPPQDQLQQLLAKAEKWRKDHDIFETVFEQLWRKHGEQGIQQFILQITHSFDLNKRAATQLWYETRKLYLRQTGGLPQSKLPDIPPPPPKRLLKLPDEGQKLKVSVKAPLGILKTLRAISQPYRTQTDGLRVALSWLATQLTNNHEIVKTSYPKQYYTLQHIQTGQILAKCIYYLPNEPILHGTSYSLGRTALLWLSYIQEQLDVYSRTTALQLTILLYGSAHGIAFPLFCKFAHRSYETKYRKTYQMISCRSSFLRGRKVKPAFCLKCTDFRG